MQSFRSFFRIPWHSTTRRPPPLYCHHPTSTHRPGALISATYILYTCYLHLCVTLLNTLVPFGPSYKGIWENTAEHKVTIGIGGILIVSQYVHDNNLHTYNYIMIWASQYNIIYRKYTSSKIYYTYLHKPTWVSPGQVIQQCCVLQPK